MKRKKNLWTGILYSFILLLLILDAKAAVAGAADGINMCLRTVIPSLFPFFILSIMISTAFTGIDLKMLRPIGRICGIPAGAESLLLLGFLGGYPIGAQSIYTAYQNGSLRKEDAKRMLGFCSNAGPAFIFGMTSALFPSPGAAWLLWAIHILSALFTGILLPRGADSRCIQGPKPVITIPQAVERSIKAMGGVCAWVIAFRVIISFLSHWILWLLPTSLQIVIAGFLELSNGCISLYSIPQQGFRFLLCACFLGFGGSCVVLQTKSVTGELGTGMYLTGKVLQLLLCFTIAGMAQHFFFPASERISIPLLAYFLSAGGVAAVAVILRKNSSIPAGNGV